MSTWTPFLINKMVAFSNFLPWVELFAKKSSLFGCFRQSPTKTKPLLQNPGPRMHKKIVSRKLCERWNLHWHQGFKCSLLLLISGNFDLVLKLPANLPTMIELNTHMVNQIFFVAPSYTRLHSKKTHLLPGCWPDGTGYQCLWANEQTNMPTWKVMKEGEFTPLKFNSKSPLKWWLKYDPLKMLTP